MYQRLDFFDWNKDQAYTVYDWLLEAGLLEDAEIIVEVDDAAHGFFEFLNIPSDEVEYLAEHWQEIVSVEYIPGSPKLEIHELCFEFHDFLDLSKLDPEEDDDDDDD